MVELSTKETEILVSSLSSLCTGPFDSSFRFFLVLSFRKIKSARMNLVNLLVSSSLPFQSFVFLQFCYQKRRKVRFHSQFSFSNRSFQFYILHLEPSRTHHSSNIPAWTLSLIPPFSLLFAICKKPGRQEILPSSQETLHLQGCRR